MCECEQQSCSTLTWVICWSPSKPWRLLMQYLYSLDTQCLCDDWMSMFGLKYTCKIECYATSAGARSTGKPTRLQEAVICWVRRWTRHWWRRSLKGIFSTNCWRTVQPRHRWVDPLSAIPWCMLWPVNVRLQHALHFIHALMRVTQECTDHSCSTGFRWKV